MPSGYPGSGPYSRKATSASTSVLDGAITSDVPVPEIDRVKRRSPKRTTTKRPNMNNAELTQALQRIKSLEAEVKKYEQGQSNNADLLARVANAESRLNALLDLIIASKI